MSDAEDAKGVLKDVKRGSVIFDDRTNSLLVTLTQERIDELRRIVSLLDVPVRQVMIEARIVEANVDYDKSRSEEHTSELQSRENLVCRLLLEKKKEIDQV